MRRTIFWTLLIVGSIVAKGWWDLQPPFFMNRQMMKACAENGGRHVYAQPVEAAGFFEVGDEGCGSFCQIGLSLGYSYVEGRTSKPSLYGYTLQSGPYRYSKKPAGHPACEAFYKLSRELTQAPPRPHQTCIAAEPITAIASRYYVGRTTTRETLQRWIVGKAEFDSMHEYIDDVVSSRRLAEVHKYVIRWGGAFLFIFPFENYKTCPESLNDRILGIEKILIPAPADEL